MHLGLDHVYRLARAPASSAVAGITSEATQRASDSVRDVCVLGCGVAAGFAFGKLAAHNGPTGDLTGYKK
eukprot:2289756-Prymnesium_polylepis.1